MKIHQNNDDDLKPIRFCWFDLLKSEKKIRLEEGKIKKDMAYFFFIILFDMWNELLNLRVAEGDGISIAINHDYYYYYCI